MNVVSANKESLYVIVDLEDSLISRLFMAVHSIEALVGDPNDGIKEIVSCFVDGYYRVGIIFAETQLFRW